jgi:NAD(P)H-dependent FMN reductase
MNRIPTDRLRLLLVSGSLRSRSTNTAVLRTAQALAPVGVAAVLYTNLAKLPPFNPDNDVMPLDPEVVDLRAHIHAAHAVMFSVPEYAGGLPGTFKNLLDWTIGDDQPGSIYNKPVAWINASIRTAADAHASLRTVLDYAHAKIVEAACTHISVTSEAIDDDGVIADPALRDAIRSAVAELAAVAEPGA